jgi:hypothetical protein
MSLLTQKPQIEIDLAAKDASVIRCAEAVHHLAVTLRNENEQFWSLPTDRLLAVLNYDIESTNTTFTANTAVGLVVNNILDQLALPQFQSRAPVTPGRTDIVFNGEIFEYVPPPDPELQVNLGQTADQ